MIPTTASQAGRTRATSSRSRAPPATSSAAVSSSARAVARGAMFVIPSPQRGQLPLLGGPQQPRREPGRVQHRPEPVARPREVVPGGRGDQPRVDPAEQHRQRRVARAGQHVGDGPVPGGGELVGGRGEAPGQPQAEPVDLPVMPPVKPMLAKPVSRRSPTGQLYEPKWDGFRSIIFRDGDEVEIGSRNERPMTRYFPEVVEAVQGQLPERARDRRRDRRRRPEGNRLDFEALQQRIHPAASRVNAAGRRRPRPASSRSTCWRWATRTSPSGRSASAGRGSRRRSPRRGPPVHLTPATADPALAQRVVRPVRGRRAGRADRQAAGRAPTSPTSA